MGDRVSGVPGLGGPSGRSEEGKAVEGRLAWVPGHREPGKCSGHGGSPTAGRLQPLSWALHAGPSRGAAGLRETRVGSLRPWLGVRWVPLPLPSLGNLPPLSTDADPPGQMSGTEWPRGGLVTHTCGPGRVRAGALQSLPLREVRSLWALGGDRCLSLGRSGVMSRLGERWHRLGVAQSQSRGPRGSSSSQARSRFTRL